MPSLEDILGDDYYNTWPKTGYDTSAQLYLAKGFTPIPLKGKVTFTQGLSGAKAKVAADRVNALREQFPYANTGILHRGTCAIDVDNYDGKQGAAQLKELEALFGPLPAAPYSTSRGAESQSRQIWFRRETDSPMNGDPTLDIEVIWAGYRYSMVAPSINPETGAEVCWYDPITHVEIAPPKMEDLPYLPISWEAHLAKEAHSDYSHMPFEGDTTAWEAWLDDSEMTPFAAELEAVINSQPHIGHNQLLTFMREIHRLRDLLWERGVLKVLKSLKSRYFATTNETRPDSEWANAVRWAIGSDWKPDRVPAITAQQYAKTLTAPAEQDLMTEFWQSRDVLKAIFKIGRQTMSAPTALLGICIIRALHTVPYTIHYETFADKAPLNTLLSITGPTGAGKTQSFNVIDDFIIFPDADPLNPSKMTWTKVHSPGSGESMPDLYMKPVKEKLSDGTTRQTHIWTHPNHAIIFNYDEVGMMEQRGSREGSTIIEYMKQGYSGSDFGRALSRGGGIELAKKSYRFSCSINVQPERANVIFSPEAIAGGFSSRFLFVSAIDPLVGKERDRSPKTEYRVSPVNWAGITSIKALNTMEDAHEKQRIAVHTTKNIKGIDSHKLLTQAKVAVALAVLDGRSSLIDEDWRLSGFVMAHSDATRQGIFDALAATARSENAKKGTSAGLRESAAIEVREEARYKKILARLIDHSTNQPNSSDSAFRRTVRSDERHLADKSSEELGPRQKSL